VQVVIALVVTPEGLPLAYEVLAGNTKDDTTLRDFLARIEGQYGRARRIWAMDRGIPTEAVLKADLLCAFYPISLIIMEEWDYVVKSVPMCMKRSMLTCS